MKKALTLSVLLLIATTSAFARYIVVLRDGTHYVAKQKWTVVNGKAIVNLENGQSLQFDPSLIDVAKSEEATRLNLTNANVVDLNPNMPQAQAVQKPSLGSSIKLRKTPAPQKEAAPPVAATAPLAAPSADGSLPPGVIDKFERAFENVGIFEKKIASNGAHSIRADLTVDTEERVFNAISAASFLMVRNAGIDGARIDMVELFMKTTTGGSAGRFQMSRADAEALDKHTISQQEYFVRSVIY